MLTVLSAWGLCLSGSFPALTAPPDLDAIGQYVRAEMARDRVPGVAVALVRGGQTTVLTYGQDGQGRPISPNTGFILGSMSKSFTALALMQLVEEGRVRLDAPVQTYLPDFRVADPAASRTITVQQLVNHTSGLPAQFGASDQGQTLEGDLRLIRDIRLLGTPGQTHHYSSVGYQVLGRLIERVSDQTFAQVIQRRIFTPIQMNASFTDGTVAQGQGLSLGHRYWFGFPVPARLPYEPGRLPTAGLISSAQNLATYMQVFLRRGGTPGVISEAGRQQVLRPTVQGEGFGYATGWRVSDWDGVRAVHHGGMLPHYRGKMVLLPDQGMAVAVLTNVSSALPFPVTATSHRMADTIAKSLLGRPLRVSGLGLSLLYGGLTVAMAAVLWKTVRQVLGLRSWRRDAQERPLRFGWKEVLAELLPAVALLALPPLLFRLPWSEVLRSAPDVGWWMVTLIVLGVVLAAVKAAWLLRIASGRTL